MNYEFDCANTKKRWVNCICIYISGFFPTVLQIHFIEF